MQVTEYRIHFCVTSRYTEIHVPTTKDQGRRPAPAHRARDPRGVRRGVPRGGQDRGRRLARLHARLHRAEQGGAARFVRAGRQNLAVKLVSGHRQQASTLGNHGPGEGERHQARNDGAPSRVFDGLPLPATRSLIARNPGSGLQASAQADFCTWLLLAPACGMRAGALAEVADEFLAEEITSEQGAGSPESPQTTSRRMERARSVGMPAGEAAAA